MSFARGEVVLGIFLVTMPFSGRVLAVISKVDVFSDGLMISGWMKQGEV